MGSGGRVVVGKGSAAAKSLQSCLTLCDPIDGSSPGSPVPGILQTKTLEWVAVHPGPPLYPKPPKSRRACPPPLSPLSTQSASHSPCPPREQGFPTSDSTSPSHWGSSTSKSGHVPYPFCRARALLEPHPLWFRTPPASFWLCLCLK